MVLSGGKIQPSRQLPMRFKALVGGESLPVEVEFGVEAQVKQVSRWRVPNGSPLAVRDAVEFARLASKRWRYYRRSIPCAVGPNDFRKLTRPDSKIEVSLILLARAEWFSKSFPIGVAQCRRTFCNHLILEFLSVHPKVIGDTSRSIQGIGSGLLFTLGALVMECGIRRLWGEATQFSAPFYRKAFGDTTIEDLFVAGENELARCVEGFRKARGELEFDRA
jgi:hypothetical protein